MISFHDDQFRYNPKPESCPTDEYENIITSLEQKGVDSEEGKKILLEWLDKKQKEADESESKYSRLRHNINLMDFYIKIGLYVDANLCAEDAWNMVDNEMRDDDEGELAELCKHLYYLSYLLDEKK